MGARELLHDLAGAGFTVTAEGGHLVIRPAAMLTDDMRAALMAAKPELLALLAQSPAQGLTLQAEADDRTRCADCQFHRPGRCGNYRRAGLFSPELGSDLAQRLQRCPGFASSRSSNRRSTT